MKAAAESVEGAVGASPSVSSVDARLGAVVARTHFRMVSSNRIGGARASELPTRRCWYRLSLYSLHAALRP